MKENSAKTVFSKSGDGRGISHPFIHLEQAVARAKQLWDKEGKNLVYVSAAVKHWGYGGGMSGSARQTVAALKAYGLIRDVGVGDGRQIQLTERALDIVLDSDPAKRRRALQEATALPKIYAELLSKWQNNLPSDGHIETYLLRELNFNRNTVKDFVRIFKSNIAFSTRDVPSNTPPISLLENGSSGATAGVLTIEQAPAGTAPPPAFITPIKSPSNGNKQDIFSLDEGVAVLQWPAKLSEASFEDFESWIQLQLKKIKRSVTH
ncbi:MAG: hypothetical protein ABSG96_13855 [Terracidiphilus sp.]|jgi:hypothetical protein